MTSGLMGSYRLRRSRTRHALLRPAILSCLADVQLPSQRASLVTLSVSRRQVFERIARNSVMSALEGFNSTVFAYGAPCPDLLFVRAFG